MDDKRAIPHGRPIDIEIMFGDPEARDKAAAAVAAAPVCPETGLHCNWRQGGRCTLLINCPAQGGESAVG